MRGGSSLGCGQRAGRIHGAGGGNRMSAEFCEARRPELRRWEELASDVPEIAHTGRKDRTAGSGAAICAG
jgi:hypothetical protein